MPHILMTRDVDVSPRQLTQFLAPQDHILMPVGLQDRRNLPPGLSGQLQVHPDITPRINHRQISAIAHQVGIMGQALTYNSL
ncbi:hypothetical protein SDC9_149474 [bioreactor metagenome]|uniref:Uncharacterized protein n=1 Tax=bioreactor metagenome TaxID=1076179 RepID=A0A645ELN2_9ZZZZ